MPAVAEIPAGEFDIGDESIPNAAPRHRRRLSRSVWIDAGPVTWAHFEAFVAAGGYRSAQLWTGSAGEISQMPSLPVDQRCRTLLDETEPFRRSLSTTGKLSREQPLTGLTWFEAQAVARFYGARLPFEVEWEIAMAESERPASRAEASHPESNRTSGTHSGLPAALATSKYGCALCYGFLQEWTADAFSSRYWRADFDRPGTPFLAQAAGGGVTVRGSAADEIYHHPSFRFSQDPATTSGCRSFRRVWDQRPSARLVEPGWRKV